MVKTNTLEGLQKAERLNQVMSAVQPQNSVYWNNLGLFRRDIASATMRSNPEAKPEDITALLETSWEAYSKAVKLEPEDPGYLNDAAVILHYYLGRDVDTARAYYQKAEKNATQWIEEKTWEKLAKDTEKTAEEERIRIALRDSVDNLKKLDAGQIGTRGPKPKKPEPKK